MLKNRFKKYIEWEKIRSRGYVVLDVVTRWNSTYLMLDNVFKFQKVFEQLEEVDEHYRNYFREDINESENTGPLNMKIEIMQLYLFDL